MSSKELLRIMKKTRTSWEVDFISFYTTEREWGRWVKENENLFAFSIFLYSSIYVKSVSSFARQQKKKRKEK